MAGTREPDWLLPLRALLGAGAGEGTDLLMFGARVAEVERGRAVLRLPVTPATAGGAKGGAHGGVVATLVDMTLVTATMTMMRRGEEARGTAELNVSFLRPAVGEELVATCEVLKKGRSLAVGDVEVRNNHDVLVAKGRGTYAIAQVG